MSSSPSIRLEIKPAQPVLEPSQCVPLSQASNSISVRCRHVERNHLPGTSCYPRTESSTYNTYHLAFTRLKLLFSFSSLEYLKAAIMLSSIPSQFLQLSQKSLLRGQHTLHITNSMYNRGLALSSSLAPGLY